MKTNGNRIAKCVYVLVLALLSGPGMQNRAEAADEPWIGAHFALQSAGRYFDPTPDNPCPGDAPDSPASQARYSPNCYKLPDIRALVNHFHEDPETAKAGLRTLLTPYRNTLSIMLWYAAFAEEPGRSPLWVDSTTGQLPRQQRDNLRDILSFLHEEGLQRVVLRFAGQGKGNPLTWYVEDAQGVKHSVWYDDRFLKCAQFVVNTISDLEALRSENFQNLEIYYDVSAEMGGGTAYESGRFWRKMLNTMAVNKYRAPLTNWEHVKILGASIAYQPNRIRDYLAQLSLIPEFNAVADKIVAIDVHAVIPLVNPDGTRIPKEEIKITRPAVDHFKDALLEFKTYAPAGTRLLVLEATYASVATEAADAFAFGQQARQSGVNFLGYLEWPNTHNERWNSIMMFQRNNPFSTLWASEPHGLSAFMRGYRPPEILGAGKGCQANECIWILVKNLPTVPPRFQEEPRICVKVLDPTTIVHVSTYCDSELRITNHNDQSTDKVVALTLNQTDLAMRQDRGLLLQVWSPAMVNWSAKHKMQ